MLLLSAAALATALLVVAVTFAAAVRRGRYDVIDPVWGLGFGAIAVVAFVAFGRTSAATGPAPLLVTVLTVLWGVRLSLHLFARNRGKPEDPRYRAILDRAGRWPRGRMFLRVYLVQALAMWFVSLPVQVAQVDSGTARTPHSVLWLGIALWLLGMVFEGVGDEQLRRFRGDPANAGRVLDRGLWRYTRHPNYFGDACVWWGLFFAACHQVAGFATALSPVLMTWLLAAGSGKPLLERHLRDNRPEYADYLERTSGFLPLPPKKTHRSRAR